MAIAFIRTIILYLLLTVGIRIMGKKQVGELETVELVFTMLISDLAAVPMQDFGIPLAYGLIPILTLFSLTMLLSVLSLKSVPLRNLLCGRPSVIIDHGVILQREMAKTRFTLDELLEELRLQGVTDLSTVEYAILENSGQVSVLLYPQHQPMTPAQMCLTPEEQGLPLVIISDGKVLAQNLTLRSLDRAWLQDQLAQHGHSRPEEVFLLTVDERGAVYYVPKEDKRR